MSPIRPENRGRYPANWREIRERIRARAGDKCEQCGVPNGATIYRESSGEWHPCAPDGSKGLQPVLSFSAVRAMGFKVVTVVCTTAHLDHTPENCTDENLRFWCQRCHLRYDAEHHAQTAAATRREGKAIGDLFHD